MLISIIMPVYNTEKYVIRSIESVKKQNFTDFEFIIIDDGSTDDSGKICDSYAKDDDRIRVVHKQNEGQGCARNRAIELAQGDYLVFLDSDDWIEEGLLQYLKGVIEKEYPDLIIFSIKMINERRSKKVGITNNDDVHENILNEKQLWEEYLGKSGIGGWVSNKCINRKLLIKNDLFFPEIRAREDAYFVMRLLKKAEKVVLTSYVGYIQLIRYGSTEQKKFSKDFLVSIEIAKDILEYIQKYYPELWVYAYRKVVQAKTNCLKSMIADGKERVYAKEAQEIKDGLYEDYKMIDEIVECKKELETINMILNKPIVWHIQCGILGIRRRLNRFKRFLYAKIY